MGTVAVKTSPSVSRLLRRKREELGLSLRAVERKLAEQGERFPASTLSRIEQGNLDPGVRRLHQLLRLYEIPLHLVADAIDLEECTDENPVVGDLETLYREGVEYWKQGNISKGMAYFRGSANRSTGDDDCLGHRYGAVASTPEVLYNPCFRSER